MQKKYRTTVELFANGADKGMMEIPESAVLEFSLEETVKFRDMLAEIKRLGISKATLSEKFESLWLADEEGEEIFLMDDFDPAHITLYESGLIEVTMGCLTKDGELTTDPSINLHDAIGYFNLEKHTESLKSNVFDLQSAVDSLESQKSSGPKIG